jgi:hypothetical protein
MARKPTIGESASDKASNRYASRIDKALQRREVQKSPTLIEQLQSAYPDSWQNELEEWKREDSDPEYKKLKQQAKAGFKKEYDSIPRWEKENLVKIGVTETKYLRRKIEQWLTENRKS